MKNIGNSIKKLLKFGMPAYLFLAPVVAIFGWLSPWPPAQDTLSSSSDQTPILVGASYRSHYSLDGNGSTMSRSYIFVPSVITDPKIITFTKTDDLEVAVTESRASFFATLVWFLLCLVGTWWFWFRQVPPNNSFKPNSLRESA